MTESENEPGNGASMARSGNESGNECALKGQCILVTRPFRQSKALVDAFLAAGAELEELPLIRICPPDSWDAFDEAFRHLERYAWVVFASANAVEASLERANFLAAAERLRRLKIACVGRATGLAAERHGLAVDFIPSKAVAESLVDEFAACQGENLPCRRILWPRTNIGRRVIKDELERQGWRVDAVTAYQTAGPANPHDSAARLQALLNSKRLTLITLTSSEAASQLHQLLSLAYGGNAVESAVSGVKLAVIGPQTAKSCALRFGRVDIQAAEYSASGLVNAVIDFFSKPS